MKRQQLIPLAIAAVLLAVLLPLSVCQRASVPVHAAEPGSSSVAAQTGPTVVEIGSAPLHTGVKRLGINLGGQNFYDSGQMLRNLTFRNPGFEGETWQSILHCKTVGPLTCRDENQYAVWPAGFLDGATFEVLSGTHTGARGKVAGSLAAAGNYGVTLNLAPGAPDLQPGDYLLVQISKPGGAEAGWWTDLQGGATLSTEYKDLSPDTPGRQALRIDAAGSGQSAAISSYFDSYAGRSFVQLRGLYTLEFRARSLAGSQYLNVRIERLDTTHGLHSFVNQTLALTPAWHNYSLQFKAREDGSAVGTVGLTFTLAGGSALLDDAALTAAAGAGNPTVFRDEVVDALRTLHPGVLRYMDSGTDFGSSLANMLAVPFARQRSGASEQENLHEDIPLGLHEFLTLCAAVGAEPWYSMPAGTSPAEAALLAEYLAGEAATPLGKQRAALGQHAPWTSVFPVIHLELGNEEWNARSFAGSSLNDPTAYARRADAVFAPLAAAHAGFDLILGSWATVPWWTGQELASSSHATTLAVAPYLFNDFNDSSSTEAVFGPMFAEPELIDSRSDGYMAQQLAAVQQHSRKTGLAVYETNLGVLTGSASQAALDAAVPSLGAGLAVADHMLLMLRDLGVTTQALFALPEYVNAFTPSNGGPKERVPLWGAVVDMGGATNNRRPQYLALQMLNQAILPTMLPTRVSGAPQLWDQPKSANSGTEGKDLHLLQSFAFADGSHRSLVLLNLSRSSGLAVHFTGQTAPEGTIDRSTLAGPLTGNNESEREIAIRQDRLTAIPADGLTLAPGSMTILRWTAGTHAGSSR